MEKFLKSTGTGKIKSLKPIPTYFYLDWEEKKAVWLRREEITNDTRDSFVFLKKVNWKNMKSDIYICTNYKSDPYHVMINSPYQNVSFLKSHLQKCIRRSNHYKAIKTGYNFYILDPIQMLRRLTIITLEDVVPIEGYAMLVWMCAAISKGYILSDSQVCWILSYIYRLCDCEYREKLDTLPQYSLSGKQTYTLNQNELSLIFSIGFRQAYGGLTGDTKMINYLLKLWYTRFKSIKRSNWWLKISGKQSFITPPSESLQLNEWILAAIDFHCYPGIINNINESYDQFTEQEIKDAIWFCSSSKTNKQPIDSNDDPSNPDMKKHLIVWKVINRKFHSLAKFYLSVKR